MTIRRVYHRILKLARTIADLAGSEEIQSVHLAEVLHATQPAEIDVELNISHKTEDLSKSSGLTIIHNKGPAEKIILLSIFCWLQI